jgi:hypothetical protein
MNWQELDRIRRVLEVLKNEADEVQDLLWKESASARKLQKQLVSVPLCVLLNSFGSKDISDREIMFISIQ